MVFRSAHQEARNIQAAENRARQNSALDAFIAQRRAFSAATALSAAQSANKLQWADAPVTAADPGEVGQIAYDGSYLYVCVAADTWVRAALSAW